MTNSNDKRILELKKQIESKKEKLGKVTRFNPVTNCNLTILDVRYNINTLDREQLTALLIHLDLQLFSAERLDIDTDEYKPSGFTFQEWMGDIKSKLDILSRSREEKALKLMEGKLVKMLSESTKVSMEIDEIESLLKE